MSDAPKGDATFGKPGDEKPAIVARDVRKTYRMGSEDVHVLRGVDITVHRGDAVAITGESGSGKSTLLNIVGGIDRPDGGEVRVSDYDLVAADEESLTTFRSRDLGFVFQFHHLLSDFSAEENVMLPLLLAGRPRSTARRRAIEVLSQVGLASRAAHFADELSGGERQRVALARALVHEPSIVLADEPTGNLDEDNSAEVVDLLFSLARERNTTLVVVTHDRSTAARADRHLHLSAGVLHEL